MYLLFLHFIFVINFAVWKIIMWEKIHYIHRRNEKLKELEESCNRLCNIIVGINLNSEILDGNKFPKVNCDNYLVGIQFKIHT